MPDLTTPKNTTYGGSAAALRLEKILGELPEDFQRRASRWCGRRFHRLKEDLRSIHTSIALKGLRHNLLQLRYTQAKTSLATFHEDLWCQATRLNVRTLDTAARDSLVEKLNKFYTFALNVLDIYYKTSFSAQAQELGNYRTRRDRRQEKQSEVAEVAVEGCPHIDTSWRNLP